MEFGLDKCKNGDKVKEAILACTRDSVVLLKLSEKLAAIPLMGKTLGYKTLAKADDEAILATA